VYKNQLNHLNHLDRRVVMMFIKTKNVKIRKIFSKKRHMRHEKKIRNI